MKRSKKARTPWQEYERRKKKLQRQGMTSREYEAACAALAKQLNI